jgi:YVTN family beta-propeller protein
MKNKEKFYSTALALTVLVLFFLISFLSVASAATVQSTPRAVSYAYIPSAGTVSVIDTKNNTFIATVPVRSIPDGVVASPDGKKVYVTNRNSNSISVIDTATNNVTATVKVGEEPWGVAVSPDGKKVYVTNLKSNDVSVINTATNTVTATMPVEVPPYGVVVSPDKTKIYVTNQDSNTVSVIDTATNNVIASVNVGKGPTGIAVTPDGKKVFVANQMSNNVSVIDTATNTVIATVSASLPYGVAVNPDGTKVYVTGTVNVVILFDPNTHLFRTQRLYFVYKIDTATNIVTAKLVTALENISPQPLLLPGIFGVAVTPDGKEIYVVNEDFFGFGTVYVIDTATDNTTAAVPVGFSPVAIGQFISPPPPETSITVISPNGSENWQTGTIQEIKWKYTGNPGPSVKIELLKGGSLNNIINSITGVGSDGIGSYEWLIPTTQMPGTDYKVRITSVQNSAYNNSSTGNFIISPPPPVCNTSTISGFSFNDSNGNKIMDEGEEGLSNWTINLKGQDMCKEILINKTMETNSTGYFIFEDTDPGVYVLSENSAVGWFPTTDAAYILNVPSNSTSIRKDFGNRKLAR